MTTLEEFVEWHRKEGLLERHTQSDHPIALEVYCSFTLDRDITKDEQALISSALMQELINEAFHPALIDLMEWGKEVEEVEEEETEAMKRWSRNGEEFEEEDITNKIEPTLSRILE